MRELRIAQRSRESLFQKKIKRWLNFGIVKNGYHSAKITETFVFKRKRNEHENARMHFGSFKTQFLFARGNKIGKKDQSKPAEITRAYSIFFS